MFGPKSKALVHLEHYLETRTPFHRPRTAKVEYGVGAVAAVATYALSFPLHLNMELGALALLVGGFLGFKAITLPRVPPALPTDQLFQQAEWVAQKMKGFSAQRRLHQVLHPGVALTLNECAGFWRRILAVCDQKVWSEPAVQPHWKNAQADWRAAADLGMAEALILSDSALTLSPQRSRAEEVVEDILETYVFKKSRGQEEPLPPSFAPLRDLAEKLKLLAMEVEAAAQRVARDEYVDASPTASRRLDEVLGQLRAIKQAEDELHEEVRRRP